MNPHWPATISHGRHHYPVRIYFEDTDAGGMAYHASYLRFAERGRTEAMRDIGIPHSGMVTQHGVMFVVQRIKVEYFRPARLDDLLTVVTAPRRVRAASVELDQWFEREGERLAEIELRLACARVRDGRASRIPAAWLKALSDMQAGVDSLSHDTHAPGGAEGDTSGSDS